MRWNPLMFLFMISLPMLASTSVKVTVSQPANNATVTSPVLVVASATSTRSITGWRIYVDGTSVYRTGATNSISTNINIAAGTHKVVVRAWASNGAYGSVTLTETVTSGPAQGTVSPTSLAFGSVVIDTSSLPQAVTVTNTGGATLNITGVSISPSQFTVSGPGSTSIPPGGSVAYNVTFSPTAVTTYSGELSFTSNSSSSIGPVSLSGTGVNQGGTNCSGTAYYVSNSGSDNNSGISTTSPWQTVAKVVSFEPSLRAGDCVLFQRGGTWNEELTISNVNGTQSSPITFGNYGTGNLPVLDGGSTRLYGIVDGDASGQSASSYVTIDGFEVRSATRGGIIFSYLAQTGITIQNNYVHNNGYGAYPGACGGCFQVDDGNYGYNEGIAFVGYPTGSYGAKIINNTVNVEGGHNAIMVDQDTGNPLIQGNDVGPGCSHNCVDFKRSTGAVFKQNTVNCSTSVVVNGETYPGCNGNAFYAEQDSSGYTQTGTYEQNVVYGAATGYNCFQGQGVSGPLSLNFYNNSCYTGNTGANATYFNNCQSGTLSFENNIFYGSSINLGNCSVLTWDYNDKYQTAGGPTGPHDMGVDPLFVNPGSMDFHLQSGSPVLNSGNSTILNVPYMGACGTSGTCP